MSQGKKSILILKTFVLLAMIFFYTTPLRAQNVDTVHKRKNRLLKEMINAISRDTAQVDRLGILRRNDAKYRPYRGFIIRKINVTRVPFGIPIQDTTKVINSTLISLANSLHHLTRVKVIKENLFFQERDTIRPYLFADNERYLRELPYLKDADFIIIPLPDTDSADVTVIVKDVFSLGGSIRSLGVKVTDVELREDNFNGSGNAGVVYASYDANRKNNFSFGGELIKRNIGGSFINQRIGYQSYYNSVRAPRQENYGYYNLSKPLLNRYMHFTYELDASIHATTNRYNTDSIYSSDFKYRYLQFEGWLGYNINGKRFSPAEESRKLRLLSGVRVISKEFTQKPLKYQKNYNWQFANLSGVLASFTFYRQNFFKTQYVYGFGINEDIPEGLLFSFTTGYTLKEDLSRPFIGLNFQQYGFLKSENYIDYTLRFEGFLGHKSLEDINLLATLNYFDHLKRINDKWKQRFFITLSATRQIHSVLNEPLFLNSKFAMPEYGSDMRGGDARITAKAESVFFSPWSLAAFRFAPLLSFNATAFSPYDGHLNLYSSVGAGVRTRNESLIFGTIELKGFYFPGKNFYGDKLGIELSTNIIFRYSNQFLKKPDFIEVN